MASPTRNGRGGTLPRGLRGGGFTYLSLIILVAIIGLAGAATLKLGSVMRRSAAERELLYIGAEFSDALQSYAKASPQGQPQFPPSLKELLRDPRFPNPRRHLRKIYVDPMTGKAEWGIQYVSGTAGVAAVYSLSAAKPVKVGNFPARFQGFEGKRRISDWKFSRTGEVAPVPGQAAPQLPGQPPQPGVPQALPPGAFNAPNAPNAPTAPTAPTAPMAPPAGAPGIPEQPEPPAETAPPEEAKPEEAAAETGRGDPPQDAPPEAPPEPPNR